MKVSRFRLSSPLRHIACSTAFVVLIIVATVVIMRSFAHTLAGNADTIEAAEFAARASPGDPITRYRYAAFLERSFDLTAIPRSLVEYETAVGLSPHNFDYWLALGQARERDGDRPAAEIAYRRALDLAPNYARTKWALGNNLVRQGRIDDGIEFIRGALEQDAAFAAPGVIAAMQAFDEDVNRVSDVFGSSPIALGEVAKFLVNEGRFDKAIDVWNRVSSDGKVTILRDTGYAIRGKLIEANRYRDAARIAASLEAFEERRPVIGSLSNGGFETGVDTRNAGPFDWRIGEPYPLFGLSDNQAKEGRYSLLLRFTTPTRLEFATVTRTVAVEPGTTYELSLGYRADLNTRAEFRWEVATPADGRRLALSEPLERSTGWTGMRLRFAVPAETDGITLRLIRENCNSAACTVSGNLWFDDFRLHND